MSLPFRLIDQAFGDRGPRSIADIGAADGTDTVLYAKRYPRAGILAFEPLKRNVEKLRLVVENLAPTIGVYETALGDENKVAADFWVSGGAPVDWKGGPWPYSSSLFEPAEHTQVHPWCTFEKHHTSVIRLDHILRAAPEYIHMDVQGAELKVLRGAGELLKDVRAIWMEVAEVPLYRDQPLRTDVEEFMRGQGFFLIAHTVRTSQETNFGNDRRPAAPSRARRALPPPHDPALSRRPPREGVQAGHVH